MTPKLATEGFIARTQEMLVAITRMPRKIIAAGEECEPMLLVFPKNPSLEIAAVPMGLFFTGSPQGKDVAASIHRQTAEIPTTLVAVLITEVWMVKEDKDTPLAEAMKKSVRHRRDKTEALMLNFVNGDGEQLLAMYDIDRKARTIPDQPTHLIDPLRGPVLGEGKDKGGGMVGRMVLEPEHKQ